MQRPGSRGFHALRMGEHSKTIRHRAMIEYNVQVEMTINAATLNLLLTPNMRCNRTAIVSLAK